MRKHNALGHSRSTRAKGFKISIDDFGTGVNSLLRMAGFPFDIIKIDKYFIHRIDNVEIKALISTITNYAHEFGKQVVAEGVETEEQLKALKELGCDVIQGYYYSKPLLPHEFEQYYY
jgi:EAL domain-containing protein (putative c-di-GMP-specific phosphodiesterase class I)